LDLAGECVGFREFKHDSLLVYIHYSLPHKKLAFSLK